MKATAKNKAGRECIAAAIEKICHAHGATFMRESFTPRDLRMELSLGDMSLAMWLDGAIDKDGGFYETWNARNGKRLHPDHFTTRNPYHGAKCSFYAPDLDALIAEINRVFALGEKAFEPEGRAAA
jgi:hypothetical protein